MVRDESSPTWADISAERTRLGSLAWAQSEPRPLEAMAHLSSGAAAWLVGGVDALGESERSELMRLEYLDESGAPTDAAQWVRTAMDPVSASSLRIYARHAGTRRALLCGFDGTRAFACADDDSAAADTWSLTYLPLEHLPALIAQWLPVAPAWSFDAIERAVTDDEVERAVARVERDPTPATSQVDAMMREPWRQWMVQFAAGELAEFVTVDTWGTFLVERRDGAVDLRPLVSGQVLLMLIEGIAALLAVAADPEG